MAQSEAGRAEEAKGFIAKGFLVKKTAPIRRAKTSGITKRACGRTCRKTSGEKRPAAGQTPTFQQRLSFNFCLWPRKRWPKARPRRKTGRGQKARAALECFQKPPCGAMREGGCNRLWGALREKSGKRRAGKNGGLSPQKRQRAGGQARFTPRRPSGRCRAGEDGPLVHCTQHLGGRYDCLEQGHNYL